AAQLVVLVAVSVAASLVNELNSIAAVVLVGAPSFLSTFTHAQLDSLAYFFIRLHGIGISGVIQIFWGLWLIPFGLLVLRCGFLPKILGVLLLIAAPGYLIRSFTTLFPGPWESTLDSIAIFMTLGEPPIILWMLIWGAMPEKAPPPESAR